jgi:hypothetical protein
VLHELLKANRELLLAKSANLSEPGGGHSGAQTAALAHVCVFFDQLTESLLVEHGSWHPPARTPGKKPAPSPAVQLSESASSHGLELRDMGLNIEEVVRNYGSLCQAITAYAIEVNAPIGVAEFRTLNWCLDEAIAQAVIAFTEPAPADAKSLVAAQAKHDARLDDMAVMTHHIERMATAVAAMRTGRVGLDGATGVLLDTSLNALRGLVAKGVEELT